LKTIRAKAADQIGTIVDFVHDRPFQLSKVRFDEPSKTLSIPLTVISDEVIEAKKILIFKIWKRPVVEATLMIKNVTSYSVTDEAKIDEGLINTIDLGGREIMIKCSVPVEIRVSVGQPDVTLLLSDTVVSTKTGFAFS
jgi:hypothetical protein